MMIYSNLMYLNENIPAFSKNICYCGIMYYDITATINIVIVKCMENMIKKTKMGFKNAIIMNFLKISKIYCITTT